jgi:alkylated DNA nucleotide flippase Atl1
MSDVDQRLGELVSAIPAGRVTTYGALADTVGTSARYVGRFLGRQGHELPWWRVVNAAGNPVPAARAEAMQRLIDDGVALNSDGRVDLEVASWDPGQPYK